MRSSVFGRGFALSHSNDDREREHVTEREKSNNYSVRNDGNFNNGVGYTTHQMQSELHRENEAILSALGNNVLQMKNVANRLSVEAREQNSLLNTLRSSVQSARGGIGHSISNMRDIFRTYGYNDILKMGIAALLILLLIYFLFHSVYK